MNDGMMVTVTLRSLPSKIAFISFSCKHKTAVAWHFKVLYKYYIIIITNALTLMLK